MLGAYSSASVTYLPLISFCASLATSGVLSFSLWGLYTDLMQLSRAIWSQQHHPPPDSHLRSDSPWSLAAGTFERHLEPARSQLVLSLVAAVIWIDLIPLTIQAKAIFHWFCFDARLKVLSFWRSRLWYLCLCLVSCCVRIVQWHKVLPSLWSLSTRSWP